MTNSARLRGLISLLGLLTINASSAQVLRTAVLPLPDLEPEQVVVLEDLLPQPGYQVVVPGADSLKVWKLDPGDLSFAEVSPLPLNQLQGLVGFVRLSPDQGRLPVLLDGKGIWSLHPGTPPQRILERPLSIPPGTALRFGVVGLDINGDGVDEVYLPEESGYNLYSGFGGKKLEQIRWPARTRSPRLQIDTDDSSAQTISPAMRRLDVARFQGVDTQAFLAPTASHPGALILSGPVDNNTKQRHDVHGVRTTPEIQSRAAQSVTLPWDPSADDMPIRCADGRIRIVRTRGNLDLLQPRTDVSLHDESGQLGRWTSRDPIGLGAVVPLEVGGPPHLILASLSLQAGSIPDMAGMVSGKPLNYRLLLFPPSPDGRSWLQEPLAGPELPIIVDPSQTRTEMPFILRDINADGQTDLVVRASPGRLLLLLAEAPGVFPGSKSMTLDIPPDSMIDLKDINGDGADEVVTTSRAKKELRVTLVIERNTPSLLHRLNPRRILPKPSLPEGPKKP